MNPGKMPTQASTMGGALLSVVGTLDYGDILKSVILGALGTIVSYCITRLLKELFEKSNHQSK